jgi:hypothetical protein
MMDKRKHPRINDDLGISVSVVERPDGPVQRNGKILHLTENISRGGLRFRHDRELPIDSVVRIHVALKVPLKTITHLGRIRWVAPGSQGNNRSIGVEFTDTPPVDMLFWSNYIDYRMHATANEDFSLPT